MRAAFILNILIVLCLAYPGYADSRKPMKSLANEGEIKALDLESGLITIDKELYRLANPTQVTDSHNTYVGLSSLAAGQIIRFAVDNNANSLNTSATYAIISHIRILSRLNEESGVH